jgi:uncharacterized membrane protein (DUF4010 family)
MSNVRSLLVMFVPLALIAALWYVAHRDSVGAGLPRTIVADAQVRSMYEKALHASIDERSRLARESRSRPQRFGFTTNVNAREEAN